MIAIDLGTAYSAVAYLDEQGRPCVIRNADGQSSTPSVVRIKDGQVQIGAVALNQWITDEAHVVRWIKRAIGNEDYRFQGLSAVEISAEILKVLKRDAGLFFGEPVTEAVITCPAYFNTNEIENTNRAGELAGFRVREIVKEPAAAAAYYGVENMKEGDTILVADLGGGTFDATVLGFHNGVFTPRAIMGDRQLGGHEWTMELMELVASRFLEKAGKDPRDDLVAGQMLYEACETAKCDFSRHGEVTILCQHQDLIQPIRVTREEFEARTEWRIQHLVMWSEQAVKKAGLTWEKIDRILLVGGSSRLRRMKLALHEKSGRPVVQTAQPDLMVAMGAAIIAMGKVRPRKTKGGLTEAKVCGLVEVPTERMVARSLGMRVIIYEGVNPRLGISEIIPHGTPIPDDGLSCSRDDFAIAADGQKFFDVPLVEFEGEKDLAVICNYRFHCLPQARRGDRIAVTFHYDKSGVLTADAVDQKTLQRLSMERAPYHEPELLTLSANAQHRGSLNDAYGIDLASAEDPVLKSPTFEKPTVQEVVRMFSEVGLPVCDNQQTIEQAIEQRVARHLRGMRTPDPQVRMRAQEWVKDTLALKNQRPDLLRVVYEHFIRLADVALAAAIAGGATSLTPALCDQLRNMAVAESHLDYALADRFLSDYLRERGLAAESALLCAARPALALARRGRAEAPGQKLDRVHFSVTAPPAVLPGAKFILDLWAHLERQRQAVIKQALEATPSGKVVIQSQGPVRVVRGTILTVHLTLEGMIVDESQQTILWEGEVGNARFPVTAPREATEGARRGLATIHVDGLQLMRFYFVLVVAKEASAVNQIPIREVRHRKAFASYASADREHVLPRLQGIQKAAPALDIIMDVLSLRSGQYWERELWQVIPTSDVFYLFWSENARNSEWVEKEWRCALNTRGLDFIDPVPLVPPEDVPPPPELASKHFNDWLLAFMRNKPSQ